MLTKKQKKEIIEKINTCSDCPKALYVDGEDGGWINVTHENGYFGKWDRRSFLPGQKNYRAVFLHIEIEYKEGSQEAKDGGKR